MGNLLKTLEQHKKHHRTPKKTMENIRKAEENLRELRSLFQVVEKIKVLTCLERCWRPFRFILALVWSKSEGRRLSYGQELFYSLTGL